MTSYEFLEDAYVVVDGRGGSPVQTQVGQHEAVGLTGLLAKP